MTNNTSATRNTVTFSKVQTGIFDVLLNGNKTRFTIQNGCLGLSGRDTKNVYGIWNEAKQTVRWIGSLQNAKKFVEGVLIMEQKRKAAAAAAADYENMRHEQQAENWGGR